MYGPQPIHRNVIEFVKNNPGCTKWDAASYITRNSMRCPSKQYSVVNTCIRHGWIEATNLGNKYDLRIK